MIEPFDFDQPRDLAVYVCPHVWDDGLPILHVCHDGDGDWQFLCGGSHADSEPRLLCLEHVIERDPTMNELAGMPCNHSAEREAVGGGWTVVDEGEQQLRDDIAEYGWHIIAVGEGDGEPAFAYSIGLEETLGHPEIILFGLPSDLMGTLINDLGALIRAGSPVTPGEPITELIRDAHCIAHPVSEANCREYLAYAAWYYGDERFRALQCFWPSKAGHFPWEPGCDESTRSLQPDLRVDRG